MGTDRRLIRSRLAAEHVGRLCEQLVLPIGDLVGVHVMLLCQLGQRLVASRTAASATLALNAAECVRRGHLLMLAPVLTGDILASRSSVHPHRIVQFCGASSRLDLDAIGSAGLEWKTSIQVLKAIGVERPTNPQCRECGAVLRELLGDPTMRHSQGWWSVPFKEVDTSAFDRYGDFSASKATVTRDLDDW